MSVLFTMGEGSETAWLSACLGLSCGGDSLSHSPAPNTQCLLLELCHYFSSLSSRPPQYFWNRGQVDNPSLTLEIGDRAAQAVARSHSLVGPGTYLWLSHFKSSDYITISAERGCGRSMDYVLTCDFPLSRTLTAYYLYH